MSDDYQIEIPQSFLQLYVLPGRTKLNAPREQVLADYELCEDMANMLAPTAADMLFKLGVTEQDVLERCLRGLLLEDSVVAPVYAHWVVQRLAELLNWPWQAGENVFNSS